MARTVWFIVAHLRNPTDEPFAVLRADTDRRDDAGGIVAVVASLHWSQDEACLVAEKRNAEIAHGAIQ